MEMKSPTGNTPKVQAYGMSWYNEADYAAARAIMTDGHVLPATYAEWLAKAEKQVSGFERDGHKVFRAIIDPKTFPDWCRSRGISQIDAKARMMWGAEYAASQVGL